MPSLHLQFPVGSPQSAVSKKNTGLFFIVFYIITPFRKTGKEKIPLKHKVIKYHKKIFSFPNYQSQIFSLLSIAI